MAIQTNSRTRVINPVYTPKAPERDSPPTAKAKPPSRAPSCMGEKKNKLANSDVNAIMRMHAGKLTSLVRIFKIK